MLESGSGSGIGNKAIIISAKQQSHTEEYGAVHGGSKSHTKEYGVLHEERAEYFAETAVSRTTTHMNIKVNVQVAYM